MPARHRIRRLGWRVRARSRDEAFVLRRRLRGWLEAGFAETVGAVFDRALPDDVVVRIPRLDVSVRVGSVEELEAALAAEVTRAITAYVTVHVPGSGTWSGSGAAETASGATPGVEALSEYLETGTLPWYAAGEDRSVIIAALVETARHAWTEVLDRVVHVAQDADGAWAFFFRLVHLLPEEEWPRVAARVASLAAPRSGTVDWTKLTSILVRFGTPRSAYQRQRLAAAILAAARAGASVKSGPELMEVLARFGGEVSTGLMIAFGGDEARAWSEAAWKALKASEAAPGARPATSEKASAARPARPPQPPDRIARKQTPVDSFGITVSHAGLVLLVPFVPTFFEATGVIPPGATVLPVPRWPRAAALLSLLATGATDGEEFELGFIKVLLGLRPESPLPVAPGLTAPGDRAEVEALLDAVIGHWRALKRTSIDGLRASFLTRSGLLREEDNGWHLRMETRGYDLLLDQLPWGISTTTLPWLTKPILTDWPTR